jgi:hypothetical protein
MALGSHPLSGNEERSCELAIPFRGESSPTLREDGEAISEVNGGSAAQAPSRRGAFSKKQAPLEQVRSTAATRRDHPLLV